MLQGGVEHRQQARAILGQAARQGQEVARVVGAEHAGAKLQVGQEGAQLGDPRRQAGQRVARAPQQGLGRGLGRRRQAVPVALPPRDTYAGFALQAAGKEMSTTMAMVRWRSWSTWSERSGSSFWTTYAPNLTWKTLATMQGRGHCVRHRNHVFAK